SSATRQEICTLYRSYLRLVKEWPNDKVRQNRGMKQILAKRIEETFRNEQQQVHLATAREELASLQKLLDNEFKEKYPISERILEPAGSPNYYSKLMASL
ncbi:hypothetical protein K501DRAFT_135548, partial [Backusella circina FSU 941]